MSEVCWLINDSWRCCLSDNICFSLLNAPTMGLWSVKMFEIPFYARKDHKISFSKVLVREKLPKGRHSLFRIWSISSLLASAIIVKCPQSLSNIMLHWPAVSLSFQTPLCDVFFKQRAGFFGSLLALLKIEHNFDYTVD